MVVRGAPCIGFTAIFGMALWLAEIEDNQINEESLYQACEFLKSARPTAVNLEFEIERCQRLIKENLDKGQRTLFDMIVNFGQEEMQRAEQVNLTMAKIAADELSEIYGPQTKLRILTHCNTGTLACGTLGTALGVISYLKANDRIEKVYVDETRPYLQGSRLTSFELKCEDIPHQIVVEGAASYLMSQGLVDAIFVGADRIAANRDTANKVGTCNLAIIADRYQIPFYVVAPTSSIDLSIESGREIEVELRPEEEILMYKEHVIAPKGASAFNPSFDITPSDVIKGVICEKGLCRKDQDLKGMIEGL